jgi:hypothetical protein
MLSELEHPLSVAAVRSGVDGAAGAAVSIVTLSAEEAGETFPAASVCLAVILCTPSESALAVIETLLPPATMLPTGLPSARSVTVLFALTDATVKVGLFWLVMLSEFELPVSLAACRSGVAGAEGVVVSMVTLSELDVAVFPARSVARAVMVLAPSVRRLVVIE